MFCPLCKAEYRAGATRCNDCRAPLVTSLDSPRVRANPPWLLWKGSLEDIFLAIRNRLEDKGLPLRAIAPESLLSQRINPRFEIWVFATDFERALAAAADAAEKAANTPRHLEACANCYAQIPTGFARCIRCNTWFFAPEPTKQGPAEPSDTDPSIAELPYLAELAAKHCPLCHMKYSEHYSRCTECGVDLVEGAEPQGPQTGREARETLVVAWMGDDAIAFSRVLAALRSAGVRHFTSSTHTHLAFGLGIPRVRYEIRVFNSDARTAQYLAAPIRGNPAFAVRGVMEQGEEATDESQSPPEDSSLRKWTPAQAIVEVWAGNDSGLVDVFRKCLDENKVPYRREGDSPGIQRLLTRPEEAAQAREIIREILQGTPPA